MDVILKCIKVSTNEINLLLGYEHAFRTYQYKNFHMIGKYYCCVQNKYREILIINLKKLIMSDKTYLYNTYNKNQLFGINGYNLILHECLDYGENTSAYMNRIIEVNPYTSSISNTIQICNAIMLNEYDYSLCTTIGNYIYIDYIYIYNCKKSKIYKIRDRKQYINVIPYEDIWLGLFETTHDMYCDTLDFRSIKFYKNGECEFIDKKTSLYDWRDYIDTNYIIKQYHNYFIVYKRESNKYITSFEISGLLIMNIRSVNKVKNNLVINSQSSIFWVKIDKYGSSMYNIYIALQTASAIKNELISVISW